MAPRTAHPLALLALGLALLVALAQLAPAPPLARAAPREPASAPLPNGLSVDGSVYGFVPASDTLYAHGDFSYLGERAIGLTVLDATGRIPAGAPRGQSSLTFNIDGRIIPDGAGGWFATVASVGAPQRVARLSADLQPLPGWPISANGAINDLALRGGRLYVAGNFSIIGGQSRAGLAALDAATGALQSWATVGISGGYYRVAASDSTVYVVGSSVASSSILAFASDSGAARSWSPAIGGGFVGRMLADGGRLYVGGQVTSSGPDDVPGNADDAQGLVVLDAASGAAVGPPLSTSATLGTTNVIYDLALGDDTIYLGGTFSTVNGQPRAGLAALDRASGALLPWRADVEYRRSALAQPTQDVRTLALDGDALYVGGLFQRAGGQPRRNLAALNAATGAPLPWAGSANRDVRQVAAGGGRVTIGGRFTLAGGQASADVAAIDNASGRPRAWEAPEIGGGEAFDPNFGRNGSGVVTVAPLGEWAYLGGGFGPGKPSVVRLGRESAAAQPWPEIGDAQGKIAAAENTLLIGRAGASTTAVIAAYAPLAGAPLWERTVSGNTLSDLVIAGDIVYGVAATYSSDPAERAGSVFALSLADGALLWERPLGGAPWTLALAGDTLYMGGAGLSLGQTALGNLAALDRDDGAPIALPAELVPDNEVYDILATEGRLYVAGLFTKIGEANRYGLAAIDLDGGPTLAAWNPQIPLTDIQPTAVALTDGALYAAALSFAGQGRGVYSILVFPLLAVPDVTATATAASPSPTRTATGSPTATATTTGSPTATATTTGSPTTTATATGSPTTTATATASASSTSTSSPTATATTTGTSTATNSPTATATATATGSPTATATATASASPAGTATATATRTPTRTSSPTATGTAAATATPSPTATAVPAEQRVYLPLLLR